MGESLLLALEVPALPYVPKLTYPQLPAAESGRELTQYAQALYALLLEQ